MRIPRFGFRLAAAAALAGLLGLSAWLEAGSTERGNRLFRDDRPSDAAAVFRQRLEGGPGAALLHYNLGTTLLELGAPVEAESELERALEPGDSLVAFRAHYNLGYHLLVGAVSHPDPDSAQVMAVRAVELNREAMRLAPASDDARWNLALSQRALDSLLWLKSGVEEDEVRDSLQDRQPDDAMPALLRAAQDQSGSFGGHFFSRGEREALARDLARSPLSEDEASSFLAGMDQSPGQVLRRVFMVASPSRWGSFGGGRRAW